jgi:hypothetical protein
VIRNTVERNKVDTPSLTVEQGFTVDGETMDTARAIIRGSYPPEGYNRNNTSSMIIYPRSGFGKIVLRIAKKDFMIEFKPDEPIAIPRKTAYFYSADPGEAIVFDMASSPAWKPEQYEHITNPDVN